MTAETLAFSDGVGTAVYSAALCTELTNIFMNPNDVPIECIMDSKSLHTASKSNKTVSEKRVEISALKQMISLKETTALRALHSKGQLADCLTKWGASSRLLMETMNSGLMGTHQRKKIERVSNVFNA